MDLEDSVDIKFYKNKKNLLKSIFQSNTRDIYKNII